MPSVFENLNELANRVKLGVIEEEVKIIDDIEYDSKKIRQQIVHTRQDVVLIYSMLNSIAQLLQEAVWMLKVFFYSFIAYLIYLAYSSFIA